MKVLVIPTWYPSGEDKLMGIYHKEFTESLNKYGIKADMLFIQRERLSQPLKYIFMKKKFYIYESNYKVYIKRMLNVAPINFNLQMNLYVKKAFKAFKDYIRNNDIPDVIHAMVSVPAGYAAVQIGKKYNIPVVVSEHGGDLERFYNKEPYKKYGLYVLHNAYITTVSSYMKKIVLKYTNECEVLPNQVNINLFKNNIERKLSKPLKLISVCALREGKNIDTVFKAIKILENDGVDIIYDIIGDGFFENYYKEKANTLNMGDKVRFLGRKNKLEISEYLKNYHALVISSKLESFSIPGIEALASGMPVITTDCLGPADFIDESTGITCKALDPNSMANAIKNLIDNYSKFDKKHLENVASKYSEENVVNMARKIYEKLID